jgi:hypothetical protein
MEFIEDSYETRNNVYTVQIVVKGPNWSQPYSTCAIVDADGIEFKSEEVKELLKSAWNDIVKKQEASNE